MASPKLLDQVRTVARVRHLSLRTERAYVQCIKRFILFHRKRHPAEMAEPEIREFVAHLAVDLEVSASTQTVAVSALLFLYRDVLKQSHLMSRTLSEPKHRSVCPSSFLELKCKLSLLISLARIT